MPVTIVTITGAAYFQPILDLTERLLQRERRKVTAARIGHRENGYATFSRLIAGCGTGVLRWSRQLSSIQLAKGRDR